jgi:hypothetical protein
VLPTSSESGFKHEAGGNESSDCTLLCTDILFDLLIDPEADFQGTALRYRCEYIRSYIGLVHFPFRLISNKNITYPNAFRIRFKIYDKAVQEKKEQFNEIHLLSNSVDIPTLLGHCIKRF